MTVDNTIYDRLADSWWDEEGVLHLTAPRGLHDWDRYIRPEELDALLASHGIRSADRTGRLRGGG